MRRRRARRPRWAPGLPPRRWPGRVPARPAAGPGRVPARPAAGPGRVPGRPAAGPACATRPPGAPSCLADPRDPDPGRTRHDLGRAGGRGAGQARDRRVPAVEPDGGAADACGRQRRLGPFGERAFDLRTGPEQRQPGEHGRHDDGGRDEQHPRRPRPRWTRRRTVGPASVSGHSVLASTGTDLGHRRPEPPEPVDTDVIGRDDQARMLRGGHGRRERRRRRSSTIPGCARARAGKTRPEPTLWRSP